MMGKNQTFISEFILKGLPLWPEHQHLFYTLFLAMYLITTVLGKILIITLILLDSHLHVPMYWFLTICPSMTSASPLSHAQTIAGHAEPSTLHPLCRLPNPNVFLHIFC
jgi:hypothetical protein